MTSCHVIFAQLPINPYRKHIRPLAGSLVQPTTITVAASKGAEYGILIKSGAALETTHKINTIIFDKTGTLTGGKPRVTDVFTVEEGGSLPPGSSPASGSSTTPLSGGSAPATPPLSAAPTATPPQSGSGYRLLRIAASAEKGSEHPLGQVIVEGARERGLGLLEMSGFQALPGRGIEAVIDGAAVLAGNKKLFLERGVSLAAPEAEKPLDY